MASAARNDLDGLLTQAIGLAQQQRAARGEFQPFGLCTTVAGAHEEETAGDGTTDAPELVVLLVALLRERAAAGEIRAAAICYDGRVTTDGQTTDAICVVLEHAQHEAVTAYLPYSGSDYGELFATPTEPRVF